MRLGPFVVLTLLATPLAAQSPDTRAVLAVAHTTVTADTNVTKVISGADTATVRRSTRFPVTAQLDVPVVRGDSAHVYLTKRWDMGGPRAYVERSRLTLVRRGGAWVVVKDDLVAIS